MIKNAVETAKTLNNLAALAKASTENNKGLTLSLDENSPNGKYERTYNSNEAHAATKIHPRKLKEICDELGINYREDSPKSFRISASDVKKINNKFNPPNSKGKGKEPVIWCVTQQKGGSGKTTMVVTLATGLSTECLNQWRIAVLDFDPQGTATAALKPNFNKNDFSAGDLLTGNYSLGEGETYQDLCRKSLYKTNLPNLNILCAREEDRYYETYVESKRIEANKEGVPYSSYKDLNKIIDAIKDDYDIIIIDTSPYFSSATYAAHFAANNLIIPMRPSENDIDSSEKYLEHLANTYPLLAGQGHTGYDNIVIQPTATGTTVAHIDMIARIKDTYREHCSPYDFPLSDAVLHCAKEYSTIYDLSASEYTLGGKQAFRRAQTLTLQIVRDIESKSKQYLENRT
ncbi:ParA family protein (plasmid) [Moritella sp. 24]|uniref:ParA family protein n=1 Tax=Moritella sp. 24 TaxID=2746230 RepID=UPI001BABDB0F|nr:ParA family protein [Moritella sp. 24]QUM78740.1 ParA family protein [Moritella sp. 24]